MNKKAQFDLRGIITIFVILFIFVIVLVLTVLEYQNIQPIFISVLPEQKVYFDTLENNLQMSDYLPVTLFIGAGLFFILASFTARANMTLWLISFIAFIMVIIGVAYPIREVYNMMNNVTDIATAQAQLPITNNLMLNLPIYATIIIVMALIAGYGGLQYYG